MFFLSKMVVHPSELYKSVLRVHVARHIPPSAKGRPPLLSFDDAYDDILRVLRTGMQWRQLKPKLVSFITVFKTMHRWIAADLFRTAYRSMLRLYARRRRPRHCCIDSTFVKNIYGIDCVGRNPTDRGRMATKVSALVDDNGVPFSILCHPANQSDMRLLQPTLDSTIVALPRRIPLYADKGYDSAFNRNVSVTRGYRDRIFRRRCTNGRRAHAKRGVVERFFSWLDKYRRLILRYERHIATYESMTYIACGILLQARL